MSGTAKPIALSAGGDDKELASQGLGLEHINELMVRLSRKLLQAGYQLAYGGILGDADKNLTDLLIDTALGWLSEPTAKQMDLTDPLSWPLSNYAAWPHYTSISPEYIAQLTGVCRFVNIEPPGVDKNELARLRDNKKALITRRYAADALTLMRELSTKDTDFRIVWGGRIRGSWGWMAGIAEEVLFSLKYPKPVLILGGFGGCAGVLADFLKNPDTVWPEELTLADACCNKKYDDLIGNPTRRADLTKRYDELKQLVTGMRKKLHQKQASDIFGVPTDLFIAALDMTSPSRAIKLAQEAVQAVVSK